MRHIPSASPSGPIFSTGIGWKPSFYLPHNIQCRHPTY